MAKLNQATRDRIKGDPELFGKVAKAMDIKPISLIRMLDKNGATLNQFPVVTLIADYLKKAPEELLEDEVSEVKEARS